MMLYFTPAYFLLNFIYSSKRNKKIFNTENKNIIMTGLMYSIFLIPLLIHITNISILKHGMSASTAGSFFEYSIDSYKSGGFIEVVKFYFGGVYIIITENLSFFLNNSLLDNYLKLFLFLLVFVGFFTFLFNNKNQEHAFFFYFFCFCFLTWSILSYFNILSFGPTRHMQVFTPFFSIFFSFAIYKFVKKKFLDKISLILILIIILIFIPNFREFSKKYEDLVNEKEITSLINKYDIGYISDDLSFPYSSIGLLTGICNMNSIKIKIQSCYVRFSRYKNIGVLDKNILLNLKKDSKSIAFINKKIDNETSLLLNEFGYELIYNLEEINFKRNSINSPLLISKNKPNFLLIKIFK